MVITRDWQRLTTALCIILLMLLVVPVPAQAVEDERVGEREAMLDTIEAHAAAARALGTTTIKPRVLEALRQVPRHLFVPPEQQAYAYEDRPLPIGHGQTISQPFIVALMTDLLDAQAGDRVLEVGTGSGYQAAVLAELASQVYTIEIIPDLARSAGERLARLYRNVEARAGDGYYGWPEAAPFDSIVVTAAASHIPPPLVQQLKPGGRMAIPVGSRFSLQQLVLVEKDEAGRVTTRQLLPVAFVPLTGGG
jgi:protein-L-isoaspartate(D-aspartate) O-methyltransferase